MSSFSFGDIFVVRAYFKDDPSQFKDRPALVLEDDDGAGRATVLIVEITSSPPKVPPTHFDQYKIPVANWSRAGLHKASYVRIDKVYQVPVSALWNRLGAMHRDDLTQVTTQLNETAKTPTE